MMARKRGRPPEDDRALWRVVTTDITPLAGRRAPPEKPQSRSAEPPPPPVAPSPPAVPKQPPLEAGRTPGVDRRTAERLRRGQLAIEDRLDLHGMTRVRAHDALTDCIAVSWDAGRRVVLVITGKGQGILRDAVPRWLNEGSTRPRIIAFCAAQPKDGGDGALYVLLKRRR